MRKLQKPIIFLAGVFIIIVTIVACATQNILENDPATRSIYREFVPRSYIDPEKGYLGDIADTAKYWKDDAALEKYTAWIGDHNNEWKLNEKYNDLDKQGLHMGYVAVDKGQEFVNLLSKKNPEFSRCLSEGGSNLASIATHYPKYNARLKRVMTIESQVEYCSQIVFGQKIKWGSNENNMITMYIKSLSTGKALQVNTESMPLMEAYHRGEKLFYTKVGQFNYACASCHTPQGGTLGKHLRGQNPTTVFGDAAQYPVYHTKLGLISLAQRIGQCQWVARTARLKPGSQAYTDLEVFISVLSNGYPIAVPSLRN